MTVDPDSYLGREVAGYQVEEVIGRGGMGVVYRAEHLRLGRKVALKVVAPQIAREPKFRERFLRESRTAGSLDHPNVVPIYDAGEADGVLYIAMRFVDGVDLATMIARDGRLEPARTARIVAQVASALDAAHEAGLVHRDVKPSNVLLPARGAGRGEHAYLGDFGLTKRVLSESGVTGSSAFLGTIAYVAPEQIEGRPVDARADQYSLACLVYECLTGHRPFERETDVATLYAHLRDPFPSVGEAVDPNLRSELDAALARAAAKKPADRYDSCGDLAEDLVRTTGATMGTGSQPVAVRRARSAAQSRRRLLLIGFGSAGAVAALAIGGYVLWLSNQSAAPVVAGNGVAIIDTTTNQASLGAGLANEPTAIAADATAAWVTHFSAGSVSRVAATEAHEVTSIPVGAGPGAVVAGAAEGLVWVANTTAETLSEIDAENPSRGPTTLALLFRPGALALGDSFLWVITQTDSVAQIDAGRLRLENDPINVGAEPVAVAAGGGVVWVANSLDQSLSRLAIGLTSADAPIALGFTPGALALDVDAGALWIVDRAGNAVVRYDTRSRDQVRVPVGSRPAGIAIGAGGVWVANGGDGTVTRIDSATNEVVVTITVGGAPVGIAVSGETVWVAVAER
ncbi:MAG TPA: protein kinase [Pleomorphomonadaceae bacterium]|nr:protein kinase [Pleomorphomonadaceae bacterium]